MCISNTLSTCYKINRAIRGKISHQKKYSAGAKRDWMGVPGVRNSVTGRTWKLKIMMSTVAHKARVNFLLNDSRLDSRNAFGIIRKQRMVAIIVSLDQDRHRFQQCRLLRRQPVLAFVHQLFHRPNHPVIFFLRLDGLQCDSPTWRTSLSRPSA